MVLWRVEQVFMGGGGYNIDLRYRTQKLEIQYVDSSETLNSEFR